jgi:hypothetical protein
MVPDRGGKPVAEKVLGDRRKALEEQFFTKHNEELRQQLRKSQEKQASRDALARVAGDAHAEVLDKLVELGISPETWAALEIAPLVEVAWANAQVEAKERSAVLAAAEATGITAGSPSHQLLEDWLTHRPDGRLLAAWGEYIVGLCADLDAAQKDALRDEILGRARSVAEAAGGFLGLGSKISREEEIVLQQLARPFGR